MNWSELGRILDSRLTIARIQLPAGAVRAGKKAVGLDSIVDELVGSGDHADDLEDEVWDQLQGDGLLEPLLYFEWLALGPTSSWAGMKLLHLPEQRRFACWLAEDNSPKVIAAFAPLSPATAGAFLPDLLARNGKSYGVQLFGGLPSRTINYRNDLIPAAVVEQCYWDWMRWASRADPSHWTSLRDTVINESEEPDHLRRSLQALVNLKQLGTPPTCDSIRKYLAERERAGAELPDDERRLILKNYFAVSYVERSRQL